MSGKQWALGARRSQLPGMLSIEYLPKLGLWMRDAYNHVGGGVPLHRATIVFNFSCQRMGSEGNSGEQRANKINNLLIHKVHERVLIP